MIFRNELADLIPYTAGQTRPEAVKLSSNENPLGPSPLAMNAVRAGISTMHTYPDGSSRDLRSKLALKYGLKPENFVMGNGSDEVLTLIAGALIKPGTNAITSESTFSEYTFAVRIFGGEVRKAPLNKGCFDLDAILGLVDEGTRVVFLCNPNNPTGTYFSHKALAAFLEALPASVLAVIDEAYVEYVTAADFPRSLELLNRFPNTIILRTFSKIYGLATLRVGYGISAEPVITWLNRVRQPFNNGSLAQAGALAALDDGDFIRRSLEINNEGRRDLEKYFTEKGVIFYHTQANFICAHTGRDTSWVFEEFLKQGLALRPLGSFGLGEWVRVTIGTPEQVAFFKSLWERIFA